MTAQNQCRGKIKEGLRKGIVVQGYPENDQKSYVNPCSYDIYIMIDLLDSMRAHFPLD